MMKKIIPLLLLVLTLTGCKTIQDIKPDTIVDIPLHPTEAETQLAAETQTEPETEATVPATQPPTEAPTQAPSSSSGGKTSGSKTSGGKESSGSKTSSKPAAAEAPTDPPTQPVTEPPTEAPTQPRAYDPSGYTPGSRDRGIADAVNVHRQEAGLPPLTLDTRLCAIASVRAWEASRIWDQSRPDGSAGITVLNEYGYGYTVAAQNLYFGTAGAETIVSKWMSAEDREANILLDSATTIGVGSYQGDDGLTYVAALFVG